LTSITFPRFIEYKDIEETSVIEEDIDLESDLTPSKRRKVIAEIKECLKVDCKYEDKNDLLTSDEISDINILLKKWRSNKKLRSFLKAAQRHICSVPIEQFHIKVTYYPQNFAVESIEDHHQIKLNSTEKLINQKL
jgi:hypothetical protein